jgi:predicted nicotinamide N-methyase
MNNNNINDELLNSNNNKLKIMPPNMIFEFVDNTSTTTITTTNISNTTSKPKKRMSEKMIRLANSLSWRQKYQNKDYYIMLLNDGRLLNVSQIGNGETKGLGTGTFVWPACHVLCKYLEKLNNINNNNNYLNGKRFIDIGSGTGLTGFTAAALGGIVTLTDQKQLIEFMNDNKNKILNDNINTISSSSIIIKEYDWGKDCTHLNPPFDYILVSDCVLPKLYPIEPLIDSIVAVMDMESIALFSYEHRPFPLFDPRDEFIKLAQERGLKTKIIPISQHDHIYCADDIEIWEVKMISNNNNNNNNIVNEIVKINNIEIDINSIVQILSWGEIEIVKANMKNGFIIDIKQQLDGSIGNYLWPSSVVLSRYEIFIFLYYILLI